MRTYSYTSSTSANTNNIYRGGYSHTTLRQNESNLLSNARSLRSNYGKNTVKGRQKDGKRTITIRQRVEIESISTEHIADRSPIRTDYSLRRNRFLRFTATLLLLLTLGISSARADMYLIGSMNNWNADNWSDTYKFVDNKLEVTLPANTEYLFKIRDGYTDRYCVTTISNTALNYELDKTGSDSHITLQTGEAGTYIFQYSYYDDKHHISVYFPQARLKKETYIYFDARNQTNWKSANFDARLWFKYYDSGSDNGSIDCNKSNALEDWVYYAIVPDHDYIGQIQLNRLDPSNHETIWCTANIAYAKDRSSSAQNCLKEETSKENECASWTPQWTTYCPPMSSVSIADNGTTTWGGNGSSSTPYLVPTGGDIKVSASSVSALADANMTAYYQFKKAGSDAGSASATNSATITASSTTGTKEAVTVEAYNYYNSTSGTSAASSAIYYEARTPYTISYNKGANGTGSRESEIKLEDVTFTLPGAVFTRTGYTQTGWATSDGGTKAYELSASYTDNAAVTLYPFWTPKPYTIRLEGMEADGGNVPIDVNVTYDGVLSQVTPHHTKTNYTFDGYWVRNESTLALVTQLIDANGNWIKDVAGYTGNDGAGNPTWVHDYAISLYAKWTETIRTVNITVEGEGSVQINSENIMSFNAGYVTPSAALTAVPANAAWVFKEWRFTKVGEDFQVYVTDPETYNSTSNPVMVNAIANTTLTAVFEPRYGLIGSLDEDGDPDGGMPNKNGVTWGSERSAVYEADFEVVGFTALGTGDGTGVDLQCTRSLLANKRYKFQVVDRSTIGRDRFCLEENGSAVLEEGNSVTLTNKEKVNANVLINTGGEGNYTFKITNISSDGNYYPTLIVIRPQQVNFGQKYQDVDGVLHEGIIGGSVAVAKTAGGALSSGDWVTYNTSVTHTATASPGYTFAGWWISDAFTGEKYSTDNPMTYAVIECDNAYAKFTETPTTVTLANDGHGHVEIGSGNTETQTTVGVTTTRELTAVPNEGYIFSSWNKSGDDIEITSTSTNPTTLSGLGAGAASGQTVTTNFTYRYSIKGTMNGENWNIDHLIANIGTNAGSKDTGYVEITLPANTTYEFAIYDKKTGVANPWLKNGTNEVFNMTYTNHTNWSFGTDKTSNCGITTAGKGTYKFIFNITDKTMTVIYPTSYQVNFGASVGGSVTGVKDDDNNDVPNGGYVRSGGSVTYTAAAANAYYTFVGWCNNDTYGDTFNTELSWKNSNVTETQNSFAKFKSTNFVIYRTGDKADDSRAALDDVESYAGGTISEVIEYRMKVHELDTWYTLCLPFTVNAVKVWDPDDSDGPAYFDIVPYYRTGEGLHSGHYFIRTPSSTTNFPIANFDDWRDPTNADDPPAENTPYIIQWHNSYFMNKYISFFGATGQEIPNAMTIGVAPDDNNVVNVYGNDAMISGEVVGAYMLEPDYGSDGAWLRLDDASESRTIPPFECFIRASEPVTRNYVAIRRGMSLNDLSTGEAVIADNQIAPLIRVYTLSGIMVTQFTDCSFSQAAYMLSIDRPAGIYILCSDKEAVKVIVGGK